MSEFNILVAAGLDDANCASGATWIDDGTDCSWGNWDSTDWESWLRFINVTIPRDAIIYSAILRCVAMSNQSGGVVRLKILAEAVDDAVRVTSCADRAGRTKTTAQVDWDNLAAQIDGDPYDSIDFTSVIQEIVNRAGWVSGNAINIFVNEDGCDANAARNAASYEHATYNSVQLRITYSLAGGFVGIF